MNLRTTLAASAAAATMVVSLSACGGGDGDSKTSQNASKATESSSKASQTAAGTSAAATGADDEVAPNADPKQWFKQNCAPVVVKTSDGKGYLLKQGAAKLGQDAITYETGDTQFRLFMYDPATQTVTGMSPITTDMSFCIRNTSGSAEPSVKARDTSNPGGGLQEYEPVESPQFGKVYVRPFAPRKLFMENAKDAHGGTFDEKYWMPDLQMMPDLASAFASAKTEPGTVECDGQNTACGG